MYVMYVTSCCFAYDIDNIYIVMFRPKSRSLVNVIFLSYARWRACLDDVTFWWIMNFTLLWELMQTSMVSVQRLPRKLSSLSESEDFKLSNLLPFNAASSPVFGRVSKTPWTCSPAYVNSRARFRLSGIIFIPINHISKRLIHFPIV